MANSYSRSRFFPILLIIIVIIIAIIAIVSIARAIFFSDSTSTEETADTSMSREALLSTDSGRSVRMTIRGPIVANEEAFSYRISVSPSARSLVVYRGYLGDTVDTTRLSNNTAAYEEFVHALDKADMTEGTPLEGAEDDTRGVCATGNLFEFEILNDGESVQRLWTSSCDGSPGSLEASSRQLQDLFEEQIPDVDDKIRDAGF